MKYFILPISLLLTSCLNVDCRSSAELARNQECLLIFEKFPVFDTYSLDARGKHLYTKKECICSDTNRWWVQYKDYIAQGDTIIKKKGELVFSIHKKDTILNFNWECEGEIYK